MIRRATVQKKCQKGVDTRENASTRRSVSLCQQLCALAQSILLPSSLPSRSFSLLEVSQKCSQLIHTSFMAALASGLETRNQLRKRQEKNQFYFRLRQKNFLTGKMKHACRRENRNSVSKNFREMQTATIRNRRGEQTSLLIGYASRVDRIRLCAQFLGSASGA